MKHIHAAIQEKINGEVRFDSLSRQIYSIDASIYEVEPLGVVIPKTEEDVFQTLKIAQDENVSVIARGAATGITGGCLGKGLIVDVSKYLNQIIEINYQEEYAICEPGVVQDRLNEALSANGYRLGPDTSTGNRATIGGMLANNAAGARSLHYGKMVDHVQAVELFLTGGNRLKCSELDLERQKEKISQNNFEGNLYREIDRIRREYADEIQLRFPKIPRRVSGYNIDDLIKSPSLNLSKLIAGSEGTLGIATKIKVGISKKPKATGLCILHFTDMLQGMNAIPLMLAFSPLSLEMIDDKILEMGRLSPSVRHKLKWLIGQPQAVFVAEFEAETQRDVVSKLKMFASEMNKRHIGYACILLDDATTMEHVWDVRKAGLGLLLAKKSYSRAIAFIEDISISPEKLGPFMERFCAYLKRQGKEAGIYGHVGSGCMHIRPYIDLRKKEELQLMKQIMEEISTLVLEAGGAMSGEHGDGLIRSWLNKKMFGDKIYQAFVELKAAFDPQNLMNPGKIVHGPSVSENLRLSPQTKIAAIPTFLDFSREGGFELAADLCNGNGLCRKSEKVMCPSFQATGDEYDTTRARAQSLRAVINGKIPQDALTSAAMLDVMDLCLECKGCKTECPSQIDMAKMKSEILFQHHQKNGLSLRSRLFGNIGRINQFASHFATLFNWVSSTRFSQFFLNWLGVAVERPLPLLANERFSDWFRKTFPKKKQKRVVLFNDTFTEFNFPEIGKAAVCLLNSLGYEVILPQWHCCGRPLISKGMLIQARKKAVDLVEQLYEFSSQGLAIVGLEPSCILSIKDDFEGLIGKSWSDGQHKIDSVVKAAITLDEFLSLHLEDGKLPLPFVEKELQVLLHGHCHQKALVGTKPSLDVLRGVKGFNVSEIDSGCCGVAGSFGYEKEHYGISMKIGELRLLPAVRASQPETLIVANGISCRSQILHGTQRRALHLAEAIANQIQSSEENT